MQKRILLSLLWGVIFSISLFSQNLKAEKITLPDSKLNNLYKIEVYIVPNNLHTRTLKLSKNMVLGSLLIFVIDIVTMMRRQERL